MKLSELESQDRKNVMTLGTLKTEIEKAKKKKKGCC